MALNGPPPPLALTYTSHVGDPVNIVSLEEREPIMNEVNELLGNPNLRPYERIQIETYMNKNDIRNFMLLKGMIIIIKNRLHPNPNLQGGRRRRTRRNKRAKKSKKSMRRRR